MLCDFAEVSGGKLFISGAGLALLASGTPDAPYRVNITLAVLGLITPEDTDVQHKMTIELVHVGATMETRVMLSDELPEGGDAGRPGHDHCLFRGPSLARDAAERRVEHAHGDPAVRVGPAGAGRLLLQRPDRRTGDGPLRLPGDASPASTDARRGAGGTGPGATASGSDGAPDAQGTREPPL